MRADDYLDNFSLLQSQDPDEARNLVRQVFCDHQLTHLGRGRRVGYRHWHKKLSSVGLSVMKYGADVRIDPMEFGSFYLVQIPVEGSSAIHACGRELLTHPGFASVHAPHEKLSMQWNRDCQKVVVRLDRVALERHLASLLGDDVRNPIDFAVGFDTAHGLGATWTRTVLHLMAELQHNLLLTASPIVVGQFEQLLMTALLQAQPSRYHDRLVEPIRCLTPRHVRAAMEFIDANADKPLSIEDLVRVTGVSGRSLYSGFQRFLGKSPMQYLRDRRMEGARQELAQATAGATVTDIATKWGFYQLGRFATAYRARYGEPPSATLARAR